MPKTALGVIVMLACLAACTAQADGDSCLEREAVGYLAMERAAEELLSEVDFTLTRVGKCEDTGSPWTILQARVEDWPYRKTAFAYLDRHGWAEGDAGRVSPDGAYQVNASRVRDEDQTFVILTFREIADEAEWAEGADGGD
ncbi:MAG TPA: hypothetical protein VFO49_08345 [Nocardioides sp.]|nr:hypothetical protein [Nocardioides sp.]